MDKLEDALDRRNDLATHINCIERGIAATMIDGDDPRCEVSIRAAGGLSRIEIDKEIAREMFELVLTKAKRELVELNARLDRAAEAMAA